MVDRFVAKCGGGSLIDYSKIEVKRHRGVRAFSGTKAQTTNAVHRWREREIEEGREGESGAFIRSHW